ncbi:hypothetical protein AVEN_126170-1 [Araneus ventricosus]|uniref:Uncharacterized protein n=1 Tax=Araneus ventricosus TaxID=182803 RepID=A0A4Y2FPH3_ARAVE|nr:hypothetical protein AVEN_126170-1 [Araneus ventricosus]
MDKWLKNGTLKRSAYRIETTDLAAIEITVDQHDDNHEVQRPTDWPVQRYELVGLRCSNLRAASFACESFAALHVGHGSLCSMLTVANPKSNFVSVRDKFLSTDHSSSL